MDTPENIASLIRFLSTRLFSMLTDTAFPAPAESKATSFATNFIKNAGMASSSQRDLTKETLNCLRVLQRILPVVFEPEFDAFENKVLWVREAAEVDAMTTGGSRPQFVIDDEEDDEEVPASGSPLSPNTRSKSSDSMQPPRKTAPALAERLVSCTIDLLFCCGFTLPNKIQVEDYKINYVIWCVIIPRLEAHRCRTSVSGRKVSDRLLTQVQVRPTNRTRSKF